jgi:hypothetical protein
MKITGPRTAYRTCDWFVLEGRLFVDLTSYSPVPSPLPPDKVNSISLVLWKYPRENRNNNKSEQGKRGWLIRDVEHAHKTPVTVY